MISTKGKPHLILALFFLFSVNLDNSKEADVDDDVEDAVEKRMGAAATTDEAAGAGNMHLSIPGESSPTPTPTSRESDDFVPRGKLSAAGNYSQTLKISGSLSKIGGLRKKFFFPLMIHNYQQHPWDRTSLSR